MKSRQVLIIDDHQDSAKALAALLRLKGLGLGVHTAFDGESGLLLASAKQLYAVIVDLNLPGMQGDEVASKIRQTWGGSQPVLIALSGNVQEVARHQSSGVFEHALTKPVDVSRLVEILNQKP
jgi:two-component system CheB/CheR fusion protein